MNTSLRASPVIVALDFPDADSTLALAGRLDPALCRLKVGKELFTRCGPGLVGQLRQMGFDIFLDLKFHDIPNTVEGAVRAAVEQGVWMLTLHAGGGRTMMEAAVRGASGSDTLLVGVTVLTSMGAEDLAQVGVSDSPADQVLRLATLARDAGLHGVVCSAQETAMLRQHLAPDIVLVTPGIRPAGDSAGDQKRVATPAQAIADGSSYLVIGRPVTQADDPVDKLHRILAELPG